MGVGDADVGADKGDADCEFGVCSAKLSLNGDRIDFSSSRRRLAARNNLQTWSRAGNQGTFKKKFRIEQKTVTILAPGSGAFSSRPERILVIKGICLRFVRILQMLFDYGSFRRRVSFNW